MTPSNTNLTNNNDNKSYQELQRRKMGEYERNGNISNETHANFNYSNKDHKYSENLNRVPKFDQNPDHYDINY
jgi:hypothetical protein